MEKVKFNDGSVLENIIETTNIYIKFQASAKEAIDIFEKLNDEALQRIETISENGDVMNIFINKSKKSLSIEDGVAILNLKDIDTTSLRLKALEDTIDTLVLGDLLEESEEN